MGKIKLFLLLIFLSLVSYFFVPQVAAQKEIVVSGQGENQLEQSGTETRFETGSVNPMWGGTGEYIFQTYFVDPEGREPDFVKIYLQRGGDGEDFESYAMTKGIAGSTGTSYSFVKKISEKNEGIYQFYFEAKINGKLIHGPSYGGPDCKPGGCGECCGVWGGPKVMATKVIEDNKIYLFEAGKKKPLIAHDVGKNWITGVAISPDEKYLAAADNNQHLYLFDVARQELVWEYTGSPIEDTGNLGMDKGLVAFSANGELAASLKGVVFLFKPDSNRPIWSAPTGAVLNGLAISADGEYLAAGGRDTYVYLWKKESAVPVWKRKIEAKGGMMGGSVIRSLSMSADGGYFVVGTSCPDRSIHVFTPQSSTPIFEAKVGLNFPVESVSMSADGQSILAGGGGSPEDSYTAVLYQLKKDLPVWRFDTSLNPVNEVVISTDGKVCVIGSNLEGIFIGECAAKDPLWRVKDTGYIGSLSISDDTAFLAAGTGTNHVLLVSLTEEKIINDWETTGKAETTRISGSGKYVAAGTGLNRFFIISAEGTNNSGAGGTETAGSKPTVVRVTSLGKTEKKNFVQNFWTQIKAFFTKILNLIFHRGKPAEPSGGVACGNNLCEPDQGETKDNCPQDCTPS